MAEETTPAAQQPLRTKEEIALELMKFIAVTTGYGRTSTSPGFAGKGTRGPEEQADALLELFDRCRATVLREPKAKN